MTAADSSGRPTWKDLVERTDELDEKLSSKIDDVKHELGDKIDAVATVVTEVKDSLLPRLAVAEAKLEEHGGRLDDHESRLTILEGVHNRAIGHIGAWKIAGGVFGGAGAIVVADLVAHLMGL